MTPPTLRLALAVMTAATATGCASPSLDWVTACPSPELVYVQPVDWSEAATVDVRIRDNEFQPMVIALVRERPYVLRISNGDDGARTFRAPSFFETAAVARLTVDDIEQSERCFSSVVVPARGTAEMRLVALRDGRYEFNDSAWLRQGALTGTGFGAVYVQ